MPFKLSKNDLFNLVDWRVMALVASTMVGCMAGIWHVGTGLDRAVQQVGWAARKHDASGSLHIIEIDARSITSIDRWPWPRSVYAALLDRLTAAGVANVVFDVDFSSPSTNAEDEVLAAALARAGGKVVLPTFRQSADSNQQHWTDSLPIEGLREHAQLAAVTVIPDPDGYVRRLPLGVVTAGVPRPSLSAILADVAGSAGDDFPIDFAINPPSIPRHSFIDIRDGRFNPAELRGQTVVIGATAVELGDRYAVPNYGVIPGVTIQALAAETLRRGVPHEGGWPLPLALGLFLSFSVLGAGSRRAFIIWCLAGPTTLIFTKLGADELNWHYPIAPALIATGCATAGALTMRALAAARRRRLHDGETGLPNRHSLLRALRTGPEFGILAAHIAEFDKLSAGLGSIATAELVKRVRDRVMLITQGLTVYRIEDRVLAWRCHDPRDINERISTLRTAMLTPVDVAGRRVDGALAIGFANEAGSDSADRAIANAVLAAASASGTGDAWLAHQAEDDEAIDRDLSLLGELDDAIENGGIYVLYQPKLDVVSGRIASVEALVRWQHAKRGFLRPDLFIPLAERNDRIAGLTLYVLRQTIADLRTWRAEGRSITAAINISATLLKADDFRIAARRTVEESDVDPTWLTFEVTESAAMNNFEKAIDALWELRDMGISISMDDYGTGQSTLSYLKQLPLDELKIDRSFVQFSHQNRGDGVMVRSTIDLAHELGIKVVAEGVEDAECLAFLRKCGCDQAQGYLISKPVPAEEISKLLLESYTSA